MIRVIIVDDEPHVHLLLEREVRWEDAGYEIAGYASSGSDALKLLDSAEQRVDIVLTDLNMPVMDGFAFLERAIPLCPYTAFVVLSVHSDYSNIRRAFQMGAVDYILKFEVEHDYVIGVLENVVRTQRVRVHGRLLEEEIQKILTGRGETGRGLENYRREGLLAVCICTVDYQNRACDGVSPSDLRELCREILMTEEGECPAALLDGRVIILLRIGRAVGTRQQRERLDELAHQLAGGVYKRQRLRARISVSDAFGTAAELHGRYRQALARAEQFFLDGSKSVMLDDIPRGKGGFPPAEAAVSLLCAAVTAGDALQAGKVIAGSAAQIRTAGIADRQAVQTFYLQVFFSLRERLRRNGISPPGLCEESDRLSQSVMVQDTLDSLVDYLKFLLERLCKECGDTRLPREKRIALQALRYMAEHFCGPISLGEIGRHVGLSESYVSNLLLQETGMPYSVHLTKLRIDHAKDLLAESSCRVYEIAEQCGYTSAEHFSRSFKKTTGVSPADYKASLSVRKRGETI